MHETVSPMTFQRDGSRCETRRGRVALCNRNFSYYRARHLELCRFQTIVDSMSFNRAHYSRQQRCTDNDNKCSTNLVRSTSVTPFLFSFRYDRLLRNDFQINTSRKKHAPRHPDLAPSRPFIENLCPVGSSGLDFRFRSPGRPYRIEIILS